jgi:hypothetical protein
LGRLDTAPARLATAGRSPAHVSEQTALQIAAVYGSVGVIADSVSSLPIDLMTSPHRRAARCCRRPLVTQPYEEISVIDWWVQFVDLARAARQLLRPDHLARRGPVPDADQADPPRPRAGAAAAGRADRVPLQRQGRSGSRTSSTSGYLSVAESLVGLNPIEYLRNVLGGARAADLYGNAFFQNSARADVVIEVEDDLDDDETLALAKAWKQAHQGIGQSSLPGVLTGGAKLSQPITVSPQDAQFLETRQYSASDDLGPDLPGAAPHDRHRRPDDVVGHRHRAAGARLRPQHADRLPDPRRAAMTALHPPGQFVKFDLSERLRGDRLQRAQANALEIASGTLLPDEARARGPPAAAGRDRPDGARADQRAVAEAAREASIAAEPAASSSPRPPVTAATTEEPHAMTHDKLKRRRSPRSRAPTRARTRRARSSSRRPTQAGVRADSCPTTGPTTAA